jgi:NAD(P)-dependent dehydrogenase (short-subunit alcohol dehydrogenase family)
MTTAMPRPIAGTTAMGYRRQPWTWTNVRPRTTQPRADKVYAATRQPDDIKATTHACRDTSLLVNNAGLMRGVAFTTTPDIDDAHTEIETDYFGTLLS